MSEAKEGIDLSALQAVLPISEIEFRIQSINKGGYATILAYKNARVDINRLNKVCGLLGWSRTHSRDNHNCTVSIYDPAYGHWVSKEDTGTESYTEKEKGLASSSFKRACTNLGIGIELYSYPAISVKLKPNEWSFRKNRQGKEVPSQTWDLKLKEWKWHSIFEGNVIVYLGAKDESSNVRYSFDIRKKQDNGQ